MTAAPALAAAPADAPALALRDLRIERGDGRALVDGVSFDVARGEIVALVGESGCGKTAVALAALGYARPGTRLAGGPVRVGGHELIGLDPAAVRALRGRRVAYVPQDPATALNPSLRVRAQVAEMVGAGEADRRVPELFAAVGLPDGATFLDRYPHQLSGGQQQRVAIAMAIACDPDLVVLDEPTTGLDVTTQALIIELVRALRGDGTAMLYITHDLAVVAEIADRVAVMYGGGLMEVAGRDGAFRAPRHPYTQRLIDAVPAALERRTRPRGLAGRPVAPEERGPGCPFAPRCELAADVCRAELPPLAPVAPGQLVRCHRSAETGGWSLGAEEALEVPPLGDAPLLELDGVGVRYPGAETAALGAVSLTVRESEIFAVVGESGSGKSTLARTICGLQAPSAGTVRYRGETLAPSVRGRPDAARRAIQFVFQNPDSSLNPRMRVSGILERPLRCFEDVPRRRRAARVAELLELVGLPARYASRYPRDLSGGEKQRVAIARALAGAPALLICDEITSALDVSVQASIIELLLGLRQRLGTAMIFISHDLAIVRAVADRVLVLERGEVRESGDADDVFRAPRDAYTRRLLAAVPRIAA